MVYGTHPYFSLYLPQITLKVNTPSHLALFEALLSAIYFGEEECGRQGRRGERRSCLSAARGREDTSIRSEWRWATKKRPSEVSHFLTLAWQRDQGQTLATWLPKHGHCRALGFSREIELHRLPETRSADRRQLSHNTSHSVARRLRAALSIGRRAAKLH